MGPGIQATPARLLFGALMGLHVTVYFYNSPFDSCRPVVRLLVYVSSVFISTEFFIV